MPLRRGSVIGSSKAGQGSAPGGNTGSAVVPVTEASDWTMGCHPFSHEVYLPMGVHLANTKMDQYLRSLGLFRYHLPVDGSCLFRAVSEVLYGSQNKHAAIRRLVCDFILENRPLVARQLDPQQSHEEYVRRLRENNFPGNNNEMHVLAQLFRIDFVVYYRADRGPTNVTQGGYPVKVMLCWSYGKQYDLVYTKEHLEALIVSQAIVYDVLYKDVFQLGAKEVDFAVNKMLYDKEHFKNKRHLTFSQWCNSVMEGEERNVTRLPEHNGEQIVLAVRCGVPPFPFKVAKCLDPNLFRNVDYLNWCEEKRDEFRTGHLVTPALDTGVKCTARIGMKEHTGFVQSIDTKANTAQVFLQSIGEIRTLPLSSIESSPVSLRVTPPAHHALRASAIDEDDHTRPFRGAVTSTKSHVKNRRSFSTGDAVTAEQVESLLRKQQSIVQKKNLSAVTKDSPDIGSGKLGGIPEGGQGGRGRDPTGSQITGLCNGTQGSQNCQTVQHDDVMNSIEEAENVARHTRSRPRKFSLPAGKGSFGQASSPIAGCYTPTIVNTCGPVLMGGHPGAFGAVDGIGGVAGVTESGIAMVPQLGARPTQTIIFDPNYSYGAADIQRVTDNAIYATAPVPGANGSCGYQHPTIGVGEYPVVPMNPVPVVPIAQFNPSVPPPNYGTIPALHSLVAPAATPAEWTMDFPLDAVEPGFTFRSPPQGMNVSLVEMSQFGDGSDLPLNRLDIVRYFFNLGLAVYRSRKMPDGVPPESLTAASTCAQAPTGAYIVPLTPSTGYQMVSQPGAIVYQQAPQAGYPAASCPNPAYASYSLIPQVTGYAEIAQSATLASSYAPPLSTSAPAQAQLKSVK